MKYLSSIIILLICGSTFAQHTNFNTQTNWALNKKEVFFGGGVTQFLGDLGGRDRVGKDYSLSDLDIPSTGWNVSAGYRFRFHPYWATTTVLNVGLLRGNDANTNEIIRQSRNLHFRSMIIDISQRIEIILFANEKFGARQRISYLKGMKNHNEQLYIFTGAGIAYYNPKAQYNGEWTALRPLSTEGQGLPDGPSKYLPITASIPVGVGFRVGIKRMWRIGLEATYVKTFSDYIDDVSGVYYDPNELAANVSTTSAALSNPSVQNAQWFAAGQQRGDKQKDAYFFANIIVSKNITYKNYAKASRKNRWKGRYKF